MAMTPSAAHAVISIGMMLLYPNENCFMAQTALTADTMTQILLLALKIANSGRVSRFGAQMLYILFVKGFMGWQI